MMRARKLIPLALALTVLTAAPALGEVITTLTFETPPSAICNDPWLENDVVMWFTETTAEDCTLGMCYFGTGVGEVWLYPCRLMVDLEQSYPIDRVEIDINDGCGADCTKAFLYDSAAMVASASNPSVGPHTFTLVPSTGVISSIAVSSCEGAVLEIRIYADVTDADSPSWGALKALYR